MIILHSNTTSLLADLNRLFWHREKITVLKLKKINRSSCSITSLSREHCKRWWKIKKRTYSKYSTVARYNVWVNTSELRCSQTGCKVNYSKQGQEVNMSLVRALPMLLVMICQINTNSLWLAKTNPMDNLKLEQCKCLDTCRGGLMGRWFEHWAECC